MDVSWDYPDFHLDMSCWLRSLDDDQLTLVEHEEARWLAAEELDSVQWLPADVGVIEAIVAQIEKKTDNRSEFTRKAVAARL